MPTINESHSINSTNHAGTIEVRKRDAMISGLRAQNRSLEKEKGEIERNAELLKRELAKLQRIFRDQERRHDRGVKGLYTKFPICDNELTRVRMVEKDLRDELNDAEQMLLDTVQVLESQVHRNSELSKLNRTQQGELTERLEQFRAEADRLRPTVGELRDSIRQEQQKRRESEDNLQKCEEQNRILTQRFAYVQQELIASNAKREALQRNLISQSSG